MTEQSGQVKNLIAILLAIIILSAAAFYFANTYYLKDLNQSAYEDNTETINLYQNKAASVKVIDNSSIDNEKLSDFNEFRYTEESIKDLNIGNENPFFVEETEVGETEE